jgi:uncharacterized protein
MPLYQKSSFASPFYFSNRHLQTIYPAIFRKVKGVNYSREKFELSDGDFIDLDFSKVGSRKIVLVLHGLEGSADRPYVKGVIKIFNQNGWDGLAMNFRGCGGTPNRRAQTYHSGETSDLNEVIGRLVNEGFYNEIVLVGFSLGGNVTLKYVGQQGQNLDPIIKKAIAFSVPCHLESASIELGKWYNSVYMKRFMDGLKEKIRTREIILKDIVDLDKVYQSRTFLDFDEHFTAPVHGFANAVDYWTKSSSRQFLKNISIPALLVNAKDDSFLSAECYPFEEAKEMENFFLEVPDSGGHVGFVGRVDEKGFYWSERRALKFVIEGD